MQNSIYAEGQHWYETKTGTKLAMKQFRPEAMSTRATQAARLFLRLVDKGIQPAPAAREIITLPGMPKSTPQQEPAQTTCSGKGARNCSCKVPLISSTHTSSYPCETFTWKLHMEQGQRGLIRALRSLLNRIGAFSLEILPAVLPGFVGVQIPVLGNMSEHAQFSC